MPKNKKVTPYEAESQVSEALMKSPKVKKEVTRTMKAIIK